MVYTSVCVEYAERIKWTKNIPKTYTNEDAAAELFKQAKKKKIVIDKNCTLSLSLSACFY